MQVPRQATTTTTEATDSSSTLQTSTTTLLTVTTVTTIVPPSYTGPATTSGSNPTTTSGDNGQGQATNTAAPDSGSGTGLTVEQTVGLTAGVIALVFLLLILLACCFAAVRRRRQASARRSQSLDPDPNRDSIAIPDPIHTAPSFQEIPPASPLSRLSSFVRSIPAPLSIARGSGGRFSSGNHPGRGKSASYLSGSKSTSMRPGDVRIVIQRPPPPPSKTRPWNSGLWPIPPGYSDRIHEFFGGSGSGWPRTTTVSEMSQGESSRRKWSTRTVATSTREDLADFREGDLPGPGPGNAVGVARYEDMPSVSALSEMTGPRGPRLGGAAAPAGSGRGSMRRSLFDSWGYGRSF